MAELDYSSKAAEVWAGLDKNGQTGIRFGLFPAEIMEAAKTGGYDGHKLCCALMDVASKNGGMRA